MPTTTYVSGGKLGDFLQQLAVVYEKYLVDQEPAIVYISDRGDPFRFGVEKAYNDLLPIVSRQPYIKEFKIHEDEPYDVDLSSWRRHTVREPLNNYVTWMKQEYDIEWGKNQWIFNIPTDPNWKDKIVINTTHYRFPDTFSWQDYFSKTDPNKLMFVGLEDVDYEDFVRRTGLKICFFKPHSFYDFCIIIQSCELFVGFLSAPLSFAFAIHAPLKIGYFQENPYDAHIFRNIGQHVPTVRE